MIIVDERRGKIAFSKSFTDLFKDIEYLFNCSLGKSENAQLLNAALATEIEIDADAVLREHAKQLKYVQNGGRL